MSSDKHRPIGFQSPAEWRAARKERGDNEDEIVLLPDGTSTYL